MSGHAPEGRAAEVNESHAVRTSSRQGPSDGLSNNPSAANSPPPIPPTASQSLSMSSSNANADTGLTSSPQNTAPASTAAMTSSVSSLAPDAVPPVLEPIVESSSPSSPLRSTSAYSSTQNHNNHNHNHDHSHHHASPPFAERFLPQHVDPSHVISSAGPSSLPIELPAIRAEHDSTHSSSFSPSSSSPTADSTLASTSSASSSSRPPIISANNAANLRLLSPFERWTLRASESQFNALAGAVGGFTSGIFTCPLDVIKTKLQAQGGFAALQKVGAEVTGATAVAGGQNHHRLYNGLVGTARVIWRDEGVRGLYRGLGPIIMGYLPTWAVWFTVYNKSKIWLNERHGLENTFVVNFWSSVIAGASSTVVTNPIWVIKTRLMSQMPRVAANASSSGGNSKSGGAGAASARPALSTPWHYNSTLDAARKMYTTEGILSFYSGLTPALLGLTHVAVQFPAYEYFKTKFTGRGMGDSPGDGGEASAHWLGVLSATILSKVLASSLTYPHEVIRTRLQTQRRIAANKTAATGAAAAAAAAAAATAPETPRYRGVVTTFRTILREEGWRAFYAGMGTNMMRAVPAATVTMLTYEYVMRSLKQTRHDARQKLEGY